MKKLFLYLILIFSISFLLVSCTDINSKGESSMEEAAPIGVGKGDLEEYKKDLTQRKNILFSGETNITGVQIHYATDFVPMEETKESSDPAMISRWLDLLQKLELEPTHEYLLPPPGNWFSFGFSFLIEDQWSQFGGIILDEGYPYFITEDINGKEIYFCKINNLEEYRDEIYGIAKEMGYPY